MEGFSGWWELWVMCHSGGGRHPCCAYCRRVFVCGCARVCVCVSERYSDPIKCCDAGMEEALVLNDCHILISPEAL